MIEEKVINQLIEWGQAIKSNDENKILAIQRAGIINPWFTEVEIDRMLNSILSQFFDPIKLSNWILPYKNIKYDRKNVAIICAGNVPLVSFHDILCGVVTGHNLQIKLSEKDSILPKWILQTLFNLFPEYQERINFVEKLVNFDAVIATGGLLANSQFDTYFKKYPRILRSHRNSIAIIQGNESESELMGLGIDIFAYYGLGCRNISKLFVPINYNFEKLIEIFNREYAYVMNLSKYVNNYDYNLSLYLLNRKAFLQGNSILLIESEKYSSKIACLHYEYYNSTDQIAELISTNLSQIQCILSQNEVKNLKTSKFNSSQYPALNDYSDHRDTMFFLTSEIK